jgi:hypothetical protein
MQKSKFSPLAKFDLKDVINKNCCVKCLNYNQEEIYFIATSQEIYKLSFSDAKPKIT